MKSYLLLIAAIFVQSLSFPAQAQDKAAIKANYEAAKHEITKMLAGDEPLSYERSIFLIENAWWDNPIEFEDFQKSISMDIRMIKSIRNQSIHKLQETRSSNFFDALREKKNEDQNFVKNVQSNYAIYTYMTDTVAIKNRLSDITFHEPLRYSSSDPMGTSDWENTQVFNLFSKGQGNCFALASLFKIYADRLGTDASICTAPSHIYIRHKDENGTSFNVEIGSRAFPGTGTMSTLTYTTQDAIKNGISLRELNLKQSVALCLVYLAKGYQNKMNLKEDDGFMSECAGLSLQYDSLSLNGMLLKAEIAENHFLTCGQTIEMLRIQPEFKEYEMLIGKLYALGYREMPLQMKNLLIKGWMRDTVKELADKNYLAAHNNTSFTRYASLSWGLFDEDIADKPVERYGNTLYNTKLHKIRGFVKEQELYNAYNFDPVLFALSVDPLEAKYPNWSPYSFCFNNPIVLIDADGREPIKPQAGTSQGFIKTINTTGTRLGLKTGASAASALLSLGKTEWSLDNPRPMPANTGRINTFRDKYIYTEKGGWLDMAHFMFYAGKAYDYKTQKQAAQDMLDGKKPQREIYAENMGQLTHMAKMDPVGEAVQDGYHQEMSDRVFAKYSAYSYEDLPSDKLGAEFGANYFNPDSKLSFGEQLQNYLTSLGSTDPQNAPNYDSMPSTEPTEKPSRTNHTTTPVYTQQNQ